MLHTQRRSLELVRVPTHARRTEVVRLPERSLATLWWAALVAIAWLLVVSGVVRGGVIYVDSSKGNDAFDGRSVEPLSDRTGPVRSLRAAAARARSGDSIALANNGQTYYGTLTLFGAEHSGVAGQPLTIDGNGATVSGAKPIAYGCWRPVGDDVWRVTPMRKSYYQLVLDGKAVPETAIDRAAKSRPELPAGEWCAWQGAVYYRTEPGVDPNTLALSLADEEAGILLLDVQNVVIRNLTLQHFRLDGINAHDRCRDVELVNVTLQANGRAGLAVGGTSKVVLRDSHVQENRAASVLVTELGEARLEGSQYDAKPTAPQ
ncbi:MAG: right-handed parallel beta-helix repeat-containing protein [Planctomycetaceae bacterium]